MVVANKHLLHALLLLLGCLLPSQSHAKSGAIGRTFTVSSPYRNDKQVHCHDEVLQKKAKADLGHLPYFPTTLALLRGGDLPSSLPVPSTVDTFLNAVDLLGTGVFAFSGTLTAAKIGMDLTGILITATIASVGGGTVRDILLGAGPVFWMREAIYLQIVWSTALATFLFWPRLEKQLGWRGSGKPVCIADAFGLGAFAVLGTQKGVAAGLHPIVWIVSGLISSCFGGIVRDVLCLQPPRALYPERTMYATAPLLGATVYTLLTCHRPEWGTQMISVVTFLVTFSTRVMSFDNPLRMPYWKYDDKTGWKVRFLFGDGRDS